MNMMSVFFSSLTPKVTETLSKTTESVISHSVWSDFSMNALLDNWSAKALDLGIKIILAFLFFIIGKYLIKVITKYFMKLINRTRIDPNFKSVLKNVIRAILYVGLLVVMTNIIGIKSVTFAALIASLGVGVGMGLSGQLQNLAGGFIILITKPFTIGDFIVAQNVEGTVQALSLFHTVIKSVDNKTIYIPNGALSSGVISNLSQEDLRRNEWIISVNYDEDYEKVKQILSGIIVKDERILTTPEPFIALKQLNDSSVDIVVRAWSKTPDLWNVYFDVNKTVYAEFNRQGIEFPFPQLTVHAVDKNKEA